MMPETATEDDYQLFLPSLYHKILPAKWMKLFVTVKGNVTKNPYVNEALNK